MTLPAVQVSSIRPKANYLSGTLHFCSPLLLLLLLLPHRLLFPPFSACDKSKCVPQHWLHVVGVQLKTNSMSSTGRFMSILQCEKTAPLVHFFNVWWEKREKERTWSFTKGHRWPSGLFNLSFFITTFFFFRKLICTKTSILPSSGLKAMLVDHQVWFSTSDNFLGEEMAWNWIL